MFKRVFLSLVLVFVAGPALALCQGQNLIAAMSDVDRQELDRAVADAPFSSGNHWRATKPGSTINVIGTFHLFDSRMKSRLPNIEIAIRTADAVYLEATDAEMKKMQSEIGRRPELLFNQTGPTLPERLEPEEWDRLSAEMRARNIPPFMASKFQPWYVTILLSVPPCAMGQMMEKKEGLDRLVMDIAGGADVPMYPLEEFDTVFKIFGQMSADEQMDMVRATLPLVNQAEDMFTTMTEAYFDQEHRQIWEFSRLTAINAEGADRAEMAADFALMEEALLNQRNRAWMDVILPAAEGQHIVVAVGAAHLSGPEGVLNLLKKQGYDIDQQPF